MPLRDTYPLEIALIESLLGCKEETDPLLNRSAIFPEITLQITCSGHSWNIYPDYNQGPQFLDFSELIEKLKELGYVIR